MIGASFRFPCISNRFLLASIPCNKPSIPQKQLADADREGLRAFGRGGGTGAAPSVTLRGIIIGGLIPALICCSLIIKNYNAMSIKTVEKEDESIRDSGQDYC